MSIEDIRAKATISVEEAAKVLGIGRASAYAAVQRGEIPSLRIGNRVRIPTARLIAMLEPEPATAEEVIRKIP